MYIFVTHIFVSNAGGLGGGVYVENTNVTLDTVNFMQNSAGGGGGVALRDSALSARNCKFYSNTADSGGGLRIQSTFAVPLSLPSAPL